MKIKAVFFDMNETLLNLKILDKVFDKYFDNKLVVRYWFTKLLHTSVVMGAMGEYKNLGELVGVVLENVFYEQDKEITTDIKNEISDAFKKLPAHDDVKDALNLLKSNNIKAIAVSNSSLAMIKEQLTNAGILSLFDSYYSVDDVKKYKPFQEVYKHVAREEDISVENICMVATHDWDLFGAKKAGLTTAYVSRKNEIYNPLYAKPDVESSNLVDLVNQIISVKK